MKFCPECGTKLSVTSSGSKIELSCWKCGFVSELNEKKANMRQNTSPRKEKVVVIDSEVGKIRTLPKTKMECPKCGNGEAYYWMVQTRGGDESTTQFFRCVKCSYTWREYS